MPPWTSIGMLCWAAPKAGAKQQAAFDCFRPRKAKGFSLIELLAVLAIAAAVVSLVAPSLRSINGSTNFSAAVAQIAGTLEECRTYAMANSTYVFVGIGEFDASKRSGDAPQTAATPSAGGRVALAAYASKDGTRIYDVYALDNWTANYGSGSSLTPIGKETRLDNLHLVDLGAPPNNGAMARPEPSADYRIANAECLSSTPVTYPPGSRLDSGYKYYFSKVIEFDPQGTARIISEKNGDTNPQVIEIGLQSTHGNLVPSAPANQNQGSLAAVQINAITGSVKIYQP